MFDFSIVTNWIHELLLSIMPEGLAIFIECVAVGVCLVALYAILAIILIYMPLSALLTVRGKAADVIFRLSSVP